MKNSMFIAECRKLFLSNKGIWLLLCALVVQVLICFTAGERMHPYGRYKYEQYTTKYYGEYSEETYRSLVSIKDSMQRSLQKHEAMEADYFNGLLSKDEYAAHISEYNKALADIETVNYLVEKCLYFQRTNGYEPFVFFDTNWSELLSHESEFSIVLFLMVLLIAVPAFDREYQNDVHRLIRTTKNGTRTVYMGKIVSTLLTTLLATYLLHLVWLGVHICRYGMDYGEKSVACIMGYDGVASLSVWQYILLEGIFRSLAWCVLAMTFCIITLLVKNTVASYFFALLIGVGPCLLEGVLEKIGWYGVAPIRLLRTMEHLQQELIWSLIMLAELVGLIFCGYFLWRRRE